MLISFLLANPVVHGPEIALLRISCLSTTQIEPLFHLRYETGSVSGMGKSKFESDCFTSVVFDKIGTKFVNGSLQTEMFI